MSSFENSFSEIALYSELLYIKPILKQNQLIQYLSNICLGHNCWNVNQEILILDGLIEIQL